MERRKLRDRAPVKYYDDESDDSDDDAPPLPPIGKRKRNSDEEDDDDDEGYKPPEEEGEEEDDDDEDYDEDGEEDEEEEDDEGDDEDEEDDDIVQCLMNAQVGNHGLSVAKLCEDLYEVPVNVKGLKEALRLLRNAGYIHHIRQQVADAPNCDLFTPLKWLADDIGTNARLVSARANLVNGTTAPFTHVSAGWDTVDPRWPLTP